MLSRALSLATVMLLIGCFAADSAQAQATNLEAGKSPSQIFASTCTACHKSPRGLLKTMAAGSLPGFLRQHYTTSSEMAGVLASFLVSNGASDTRYVGGQGKPGQDAKTDARPGGPPEQLDRQGHRLHPGAPPQEVAKPEAQPQQAAKPDADGLSPQGEPGRHGRNAKRLARPGEAPEGAKPGAEGQPPLQAEGEPDGRKSRMKLGRRGKPGIEEPPKTDAAKQESGEPKEDKPKGETAKDEGSKPEGDKPSGEASAKSESPKPEGPKSESPKPETAKVDAPKATGGETPVLRADPVSPVTPAPKSAEGETHPMQTAAPAPPPAATSGAAVTGTAEPATPPAPVTAAAPPPAPVAPAGPPAPPISQ
jgi:hypothetical protein